MSIRVVERTLREAQISFTDAQSLAATLPKIRAGSVRVVSVGGVVRTLSPVDAVLLVAMVMGRDDLVACLLNIATAESHPGPAVFSIYNGDNIGLMPRVEAVARELARNRGEGRVSYWPLIAGSIRAHVTNMVIHGVVDGARALLGGVLNFPDSATTLFSEIHPMCIDARTRVFCVEVLGTRFLRRFLPPEAFAAVRRMGGDARCDLVREDDACSDSWGSVVCSESDLEEESGGHSELAFLRSRI